MTFGWEWQSQVEAAEGRGWSEGGGLIEESGEAEIWWLVESGCEGLGGSRATGNEMSGGGGVDEA